jgi:hypothetical protein
MTKLTLLLTSSLLLLCAPARGQRPPSVSPDGLWEILPSVEFPEDYSAPTAYVALRLDDAGIRSVLATAPRETFGPVPPGTMVFLPRADGSFTMVNVALTQTMEAGLAAMFPQIRTYVFEDVLLAGRISATSRGLRFAAQTTDGITRVEPVETAQGRVYVAYLDRNRTDPAAELHEPHDRGDDDEPPPPPAVASLSALVGPALEPLNVTSGQQLRIYRLAASTTGEFFQARDLGGGLEDVIASLVDDLSDANAVFEPEVGVRLMLADVSEDVIYSDPDTDPFDPPNECTTSGDPCSSDSDCDTDNGETCGPTPCDYREANKDNFGNEGISTDDYDLGFLFATRSGGGNFGCAWYVVCKDDDHEKARGAGRIGNGGTNGAGGLLSHEGGHMLGARHTWSGMAGACTQNEFTAGDSESGYEPGSGTTRMSYLGLCDSDPDDDDEEDNVDVSEVVAGAYFHSRSFDEIAGNAQSGEGSTCGTLVNTANDPPMVDAGPDYTIPRQTPFTLTGEGTDADALAFNWEQYDRAETRRPIDTDDGEGPIIRSVPPTPDPTRTIPHLQDLLDGITRKGEILPQMDRDLNFRFIARDNRMGGGGVAYDSMVVHVEGEPFFITSPNSGSLQAGCQVPLTWQVGGGDVAPFASVLFSSDGGQHFDTTVAASVANDGAYPMTVPCEIGTSGRIKLQAVDNIFFDINDEDLTVYNNPPMVEVSTAGGSVDDACQFTVEFEATATDECGLSPGDVEVELIKGAENFTLGVPTININPVSSTEVGVTGSVVVSDLLSSPAVLTVMVTATDACGAKTSDTAIAMIVDDIPPEIDVALNPTELWPPNHKLVAIEATVVATDNCPGVSYVLSSITSNEPDNGMGDGDTVDDIQDAVFGTPDTSFSLRSERAGSGTGRIYTALFTATDGSGNTSDDSATVTVPKSQ